MRGLRSAFAEYGLPPLKVAEDVLVGLLDLRFQDAELLRYRFDIPLAAAEDGTARAPCGGDFLAEQVFAYTMHNAPTNNYRIRLPCSVLQIDMYMQQAYLSDEIRVCLAIRKIHYVQPRDFR